MGDRIEIINLGGVNCYLIKAGETFCLIDTGFPSKRAELEKRLDDLGCRRGNLKLIVLTHGDVDHAGNGSYLREKYGPLVAVHGDDAGMVETGDMFLNRKVPPDRVTLLFRILMFLGPIFFPPGKFEKFKPDIILEDGQDLSGFGLHARVVSIPGHSKGSIGVLTADGDLFCGDLLANTGKPEFHMIIDDMTAAKASIEKLRKMNVKVVYPGHGKAFPLEVLR